MCRKLNPHTRDHDRQSICESTVTVPFHAGHPSFLLETIKLRFFIKKSKFWSKVGNDAPSIHTRIVDYVSWLHTVQVVGPWGVVLGHLDHESY